VPAASSLSPRVRNLAAAVIHRGWAWMATVGCVGPDDALGRRFAAMGRGSCIAFPPGSVFGEAVIEIGSATLIGPSVSLAAGLPGQPFGQDRHPIVVIGDRCSIGRGTSIVGIRHISIGDDVAIGPNVYITDHNHSYRDVDSPIGTQWPTEGTVTIGSGSWIGTGVIVLPGSQIGRNVAVAAGSIVRGPVPDHSVVAGAPARVVRRHVQGEGWVPPLPERSSFPPEGWAATGPGPGTGRSR